MSNATVDFNSLLNINLFVANLRLVEGIDYCALKCGGVVNTACGCGHTQDCSRVSYNELPPGQPERQHALDVHNEYRERLAAGGEPILANASASNIMALHYDFELEYLAMCWMRKCVYGHDKCRRSSKHAEVGQNIYYNTKPPCDDIDMFRWAVDTWYGEVGQANETCVDKAGKCPQVSRFLQVVWAKSTTVGCARAEIDGGTCRIICNYGPGLKKGEAAFKRGAPASACPGNKTNLKYRSLCGDTELFVGEAPETFGGKSLQIYGLIVLYYILA